MTLQNQIGRTSFDRSPKRGLEGTVGEGPRPWGRPSVYPTRRAVWTLVFVGEDSVDGEYSATLTCEGFPDLVVEFTVDTGELLDMLGEPYDPSVPVIDVGDVGDAVVLRLFETDGALDMVELATNDAGEVTVTWRVAGRLASITDVVVPALVDAEATEVEVAVGSPIPVGRWVVRDTIDGKAGVRLPVSTDTAATIAGVVLRTHTGPGGRLSPALITDELPAFQPGDDVTPLERVTGYLRNAGNVAAVADGLVYVVINDAGDAELGESRADADSGNAVAPTLLRVRWLEPVAAGAVGLVGVTPI